MNSFTNLLLQADMAEETRLLFKDEKIYTVIAVILIVWLGISIFLILTGQKVKKLEKEVAELKQKQNLGGSDAVEERRIDVKRNKP